MTRVPTADETIGDVLATWPGATRVLVDHGMHCVGCAIAPFDTVAEACAIYGVSVEQLLAELARQSEGGRQDRPDEPDGPGVPQSHRLPAE